MNLPAIVTQDDRYHAVMCAIWFAAVRYEPADGKLLAHIDVGEAAHAVLGMLDDLELLPKLPVTIS